MTVTDVRTDPTTKTLTLVAEFTASAQEVWRLWEDPRLLERWWGPPTYPATVLEHDLTPGGRVTYLMTGPEGDQPRGWWRVTSVRPPRRLEFEDGFAGEDGAPDPGLPTTTTVVTIEDGARGGTRMEVRSTFPTTEAMEQLLAMGAVDGLTQAIGQMDALLGAQRV